MNIPIQLLTSRLPAWLLELLAFGYKNALACLFPVFIFLMLALSTILSLPLARYDFLLLSCVLMQVLMVATKLETWDELKVIAVFHLLGLGLELFKTYIGSWSYPESAFFKFGNVPLYSGFMYASVASFMIQAWRHFDLELQRWAPAFLVIPLGAAIYLNFFSNYWLPDMRFYLIAAVMVVFFPTWIAFTAYRRRLRMPLVMAFVLIGFFVWLAENIATYFGAWQYPHQVNGWHVVDIHKISSWALLVIVSFMIVAQLKRVKSQRTASD